MAISNQRCLVGCVLVALLLLGVMLESCEARYLPTRGDNARREQIKDLLRALMEITPGDAIHGGYGGYEYGAPFKAVDRND